MEAVGIFHDEEWESLSKMFACDQDSDFLLNSVGIYGFSFSLNDQPSSFMAEESSFLPSAADLDRTTNFYSEISQESSNSGDVEGALFQENGHSMNYCCDNDDGLMMAPVFSDDMMREILQLKAELSEMGSCSEMQQVKRKYDETETQQYHNNHNDNDNDLSDQSPKKKARGCRDSRKIKDSRKKKKPVQISNDEGNGQTSSICSSEEDDSNSNGKGKATRGTATDAQSLYARRRRERINERLRILQNLVPNGTKVDISTMLEEAVHYVKFLQLQIKLLSSDQMWMYAPIAYNGMDMGFYHKIMPDLWS